MDRSGQIYFAPEGEIPDEDIERLREAAKADMEDHLERFLREQTLHDPNAQVKLTGHTS